MKPTQKNANKVYSIENLNHYQSILVQLTKAGNRRARTRKVEPTGEKHRTILRSNVLFCFSSSFKIFSIKSYL